eukprot:CAMPEP_0114339894 /NCGR_PEP_ID=MMETSP0101-20121206/8018_1 /TAXON_ID=38822 ORGANISM="Pteridomonas danica, Strain PT" /NCGR_SAMPLE_ID=MMETSP0101 /ASSEMBLY_ACC=CAM_ASM_000211 /LENGTH=673 /DNA_ID=CAMNT_0001472983 /DNA_START=14 /DNA_END=2036 /DNA_ORIENTATION=+
MNIIQYSICALLALSIFVEIVIAEKSTAVDQPNIVFVMLDDVGFADLSYNNEQKMIPTPILDNLVSNGIKFDWHYSHPTCTPSRASLITGKYSANVGLAFAMLPGSPIGLPYEHRTLPQLIREQGYTAKMVGKWHLGGATWAQTPVGRGFENHVGSFSYDLTSYGKQNFRDPWNAVAVDWMRSDESRNFSHYAEPRHATIAITSESMNILQSVGFGDHSNTETMTNKPLFLYTAYTAAHSPIEPTPEHEKICSDLLTEDGKQRFPHIWRRGYCGMVIGLDEGVGNITSLIEQGNGRDTILVVASDNGGSPWFGGMNYPLRSTKLTVYEGGCRVPAFAVDFSTDKRFFGPGGRTHGGLIHFSDWLPTFLGLSGVSSSELESMRLSLGWDGVDQGPAIRAGADSWRQGPRKTILYDLSLEGETLFGAMTQIGYRYENWKCVAGVTQDPHWFFESTNNKLNSTDEGLIGLAGEVVIRILDGIFGNAAMDPIRSAITHTVVDAMYMKPQFKTLAEDKHRFFQQEDYQSKSSSFDDEPSVFFQTSIDSPLLAPFPGEEGCGVNLAAVLSGMQLFDLDNDPEERFDVSKDHPEIVQKMIYDLQKFCIHRPQQQKYFIGVSLEIEAMKKMLVDGDCSMNPVVKPKDCRFQHPFLEDDFNPNDLTLINTKDDLMRLVAKKF